MNANDEPNDSLESDRQALLNHLLDAVKQCQIRFGGRTELATESDSRVVCLCAQFEAVLQHGIRKNNRGGLSLRHVTEMMKGLNTRNSDSEPVFWHFIRTLLNKHEYERYMMLKNTVTDIGRGRAWLRSALNESSLERYMGTVIADPNHISKFYEDWAFLMDLERNNVLPVVSAGLGSILFAINIDNPDLNTYRNTYTESPVPSINTKESTLDEPLPIISTSVGSHPGGRKKKRKRPCSQVISFDDNDFHENHDGLISELPSECNSAPPTCLSSPVVTSGNFTALTDSSPVSKTNVPAWSKNAEISPVLNSFTSLSLNNTQGNNVQQNAPYTEENINKLLNSQSNDGALALASLSAESVETVKVKTKKRPTNGNMDSIVNIPFLSVQDLSNLQVEQGPDASPEDNSIPPPTTLTPIDNASVGELIPLRQGDDVPSSEDSVSIPSYGEETENAAAALAVLQRGVNWGLSGSVCHSAPVLTGVLADRKLSEPRSRSDTLSMTSEELRDALLAVLHRKDELEETNNSLRNLLDREMEMCAGLRAESEELKRQHEEKLERQEMKLQTLTRENDLLKHQLKKYIAAVQMLKRDGYKAQETLTGMIGDIHPAIPEPPLYVDHQYEAQEYEKKLVQVAEMHGELMEFNERLHRLLLQREATIRRLRDDLIDLRGPLPDDNQTSDDDISITSDYDASSQTAASRPLINIWIPSAFLTGRSTNLHHVYQVYIRIRDDEWNVYRRYAEFYALHKCLKKKYPIVNTFDFPPKKTLGNKDARVVEERRRRFQHYLRSVINWMLQTNTDLTTGLDRETIISLLPFFGEKDNDAKTNLSHTMGNRLRFSGHNASPSGGEGPVQHYMGL